MPLGEKVYKVLFPAYEKAVVQKSETSMFTVKQEVPDKGVRAHLIEGQEGKLHDRDGTGSGLCKKEP